MRNTRERESSVSEEDLSAFADGQLPPNRARRVADHLRTHPVDADRVHGYWRREAEIRHAFASILEEPIPDDCRVRDDRSVQWPRAAAVATAAVVVLSVLVAWPWRAADQTSQPDFVSVAFDAYAESRVDVDPGDVPESAPRFPGTGLEPVFHRHLQVGEHQVDEYRYRGASGEPVALYAMEAGQAGKEGLFQVFERAGARLVEWRIGGEHYALVGRQDVAMLTQLAIRARGNLSAPSSTLADAPRVTTPSATSGETIQDAGSGRTQAVPPPTDQEQIPMPIRNAGGDT